MSRIAFGGFKQMIFDIFLLIDRGEEHAPVAVYFGVFVRSHVGNTSRKKASDRPWDRTALYYLLYACRRRKATGRPSFPLSLLR